MRFCILILIAVFALACANGCTPSNADSKPLVTTEFTINSYGEQLTAQQQMDVAHFLQDPTPETAKKFQAAMADVKKRGRLRLQATALVKAATRFEQHPTSDNFRELQRLVDTSCPAALPPVPAPKAPDIRGDQAPPPAVIESTVKPVRHEWAFSPGAIRAAGAVALGAGAIMPDTVTAYANTMEPN